MTGRDWRAQRTREQTYIPPFRGRFDGKYVQVDGGHRRGNKLAAGMSATVNRANGRVNGDGLTLCVHGTTDNLRRWLDSYTEMRRDKTCPCCQQIVVRRVLRKSAYRRIADLRAARIERNRAKWLAGVAP